jgi:hypothetical protein
VKKPAEVTFSVPVDRAEELLDSAWASLADWRDATADELRLIASLVEQYRAVVEP